MTASPRSEHFEPSDYLGVLRRRWWVVLVLTCIGGLLCGGYAKVAPKTYTASVLVQVNAVPNAVTATGGRTSGPVNMDNEAQIVQSLTVASLAAKSLHSPEPVRTLAKQISVAVPANTTFLQISCAAPTPRAAALCADAFGNAYIFNRNDVAVGQLTNDANTLQAKITSLQDEIARYKARLATLPANSPSRTTSELRVSEDTGAISSALTYADQDEATLANLSQPGNTAVGSIATPASQPSSPTSPQLLLLVPSGLVAGLVIGLLLAFFLDRRDPRLRSARDVERYLSLQVLLDASSSKRDIFGPLASPRSEPGRAFSELAQYVALALGEGNHVLLVAGMSAGDGSTVVAANLAVNLARSRSDVILLSTDHRSAASPLLQDTGNRQTLADVAAGRATIAEVARRSTQASRLRVITGTGSELAGSQPLLAEAYRDLISEMRRESRYVIIEAQSVGEDADAYMFSEFADATLSVVEIGQTRRADALDSLYRLDRLHSSVLGAAVLPAGHRRSRPAATPPKPPVASPAIKPPLVKTPVVKGRPRPADAGPADVPSDSGVRAGVTASANGRADWQADGPAAMPTAPRGAGETWPIPIPVASDAHRKRTSYQDPTDKTARG